MRTPGYPVVALCLEDPAAFEQQDWPFHTPQPFKYDRDFEVSQFGALDLGLGDSLAQHVGSPLSAPPRRALQYCSR